MVENFYAFDLDENLPTKQTTSLIKDQRCPRGVGGFDHGSPMPKLVPL